MVSLYNNKFPTPVPIQNNRHAILMGFINGFPLNKVKSIEDSYSAFNTLIDLLEKFAKNGLVHGDFNEFNLMIDNLGRVFVIDFPQMVSTTHKEAEFFYQRDLNCIKDLFKRRFNFDS